MRHIYIDVGANWCNTVDLYKKIPEYQVGQIWQIYAFEATPIISAYLESCTEALNAGRTPPTSPLPPSGSSNDLFSYAVSAGCSRRAWKQCIQNKLRMQHPPTNNATSAEVRERLNSAKYTTTKTTYIAIPRAASVSSSGVVLYGATSLWQLVRGGALAENAGTRSSDLKGMRVASVNLVRWMTQSFTPDDFVVLKMDIEGAEQHIIPQMIRQNAVPLVDMFLWECHYNANHNMPNFTKCHTMEHNLRLAGLSRIHREPYF